MKYTTHYAEERQTREDLIKKIGYGEIIQTKIIEDGIHGKPKKYAVSSTGIITIMDCDTDYVITKLIARPRQIRRIYQNERPPQFLINVALEHQRLGYNEIQSLTSSKFFFIFF